MNAIYSAGLPAFDLPLPPTGARLSYAIAFDLSADALKEHCSAKPAGNAESEIRIILKDAGFAWRQGTVYFGDPARVNAVTCVLAAQRLARELGWFTKCVRDIRMLRIEENSDLGSAVEDSGSVRRTLK